MPSVQDLSQAHGPPRRWHARFRHFLRRRCVPRGSAGQHLASQLPVPTWLFLMRMCAELSFLSRAAQAQREVEH